MRYFIAITIPETTKQEIAKFQSKLHTPFLTGNWVHHNNYHITLKFLGNIKSDYQLNQIEEILSKLTSSVKPFSLTISNTGVFPNLDYPRTIWLSTDSAELTAVAHSLETQLTPLGLDLEKKDFVGHITLARIKRGKIKPAWLEERTTHFKPLTVPVKKISLYSSVLTEKGPVYSIVKHFRFNR